MKKFEVGKKYYCGSIADSEAVFEIVKRTEKNVTIKDDSGKLKRRKIYFDAQEQEYIYVKDSMGRTLHSTKEVKEQTTAEKTQYVEENEAETQYIERKTSNVIAVDFQNQKMNFDKENFLQSNFGKLLKGYVDYWQQSLKEENKEYEKVFTGKWTIFQMAIEHCYGVKYDIKKDAYHIGIATRDKKDWLFQFKRPGIIDQPAYQNEKQRCECWKCELRNICEVAEKVQRLPKKYAPSGGLGLCHKLKEE